jgi:hypothetical protein
MALSPCTECGYTVSSKAAACPRCGARPSKAKRWLWILGAAAVAVVGLFVIGLVSSSSPEAQDRIAATMAIDDCWKEQKRPSNNPATARFVAGTCELLESRFQTKYGRKP